MLNSIRASALLWTTIIFALTTMSPVYGQLSGNYQIDPTGNGDYLTVAEAFADLQTLGVSATTTFLLTSGVHVGHAALGEISGTSAVKTVTFKSAVTGGAEIEYIASSAADNYVLQINGADFVRFSDITFTASATVFSVGKVVDINGVSVGLRFAGNTFNAPAIETSNPQRAHIHSATGSETDGLEIIGNTFNGGSVSIDLSEGGISTSIFGNTIIGAHHGIAIRDRYNVLIVENEIHAGQAGITTINSADQFIRDNQIVLSVGAARGIATTFSTGDYQIERNVIQLDFDGVGIRNANDAFGSATMANNVVTIGGCDARLTYCAATGIEIAAAEHLNVLHNSVNLTTASQDGIAAFRYKGTSGSGNVVKNNVFASLNGRRAIWIESEAPLSSFDNNVLYTSGPTLAYWIGDRTSLADLQSATAFNASSYDYDPSFSLTSMTDLQPLNMALDGLGDSGISMILDVNQQFRSSATPSDPGAYSIDTPLPIEAPAVFAVRNGRTIVVSWRIDAGNSAAYFEIQGKTVPEEVWQPIGIVDRVDAFDYLQEIPIQNGQKYFVRVAAFSSDGLVRYSAGVELAAEAITGIVLSSAYPNPVHGSGELAMSVAVEQHVTATLFDSAGRSIATLFDGVASPGEVETIRLERSELASGIYFVRATGRGGQTATRSFIAH